MEELFLKIALCDTDAKFEQIVNKYLIHIIESLESNQKKALEIITHIKKRIVPLTNVQLPVVALFQLYGANKSAPINMFSTVFLKIGIPRVSADHLCEILIQCILQCHRDPIFLSLWSNNLVKYIRPDGAKLTKDQTISLVEKFISKLRSKVSSDHFIKILEEVSEHMLAILAIDIQPVACVCPQQVARLQNARTNQFTKKSEVTDEEIRDEKTAITTFIVHWSYIVTENRLPVEKSVFFLSLMSYQSPTGNAEGALKALEYSLENPTVVRSIFKLYLGEVNSVSNASLKHAMAPERLRIQLTKMLIKSKQAAATFPASFQISFDLLRDDWKRIARSVAFDWLNHLRAQSQISPKVVPLLLERIIKILASDEPDDRLFNLLPSLIELNETAFQPKMQELFDILIASLQTSPSATTPLLALVRNCAKRNFETTVLLAKLQTCLQNVPKNDKWFTISCLRAVNALAPFEPNIGPIRTCILTAVCNSDLTHEIRQESLSLLGIVSLSSILNFLQSQPNLRPTLELVSLIKFGILNKEITKYHNPVEGDSSKWYTTSISVFKEQSRERIGSLQKILLNFETIGQTTDTSDLVLSQTELLESTVRAGFPLDNSNFFVINSGTKHARPEKLTHLLQGHTFGINHSAASLIASQMVATSFAEFAPLFETNHDQNQQSAQQVAIAMYCARVDSEESLMAAVELIQALIDSTAWETHSVTVLERILTSLGNVSARVEIDTDLIDRVGKCLKHANDKVIIAAITAIGYFAGSQFLQSSEATSKLLEVILSVEKVETTPMQIAMGTAVVAIATGQTPPDKFSQKFENKKLKLDVIEAVIARTFAPEKGKTKGTGIWLSSLVDVGHQNDLANKTKYEIFCGLLSRLFIAPHEASYCAKALRIIFDNDDKENRIKYKHLVQNVIKHNKAPDRNGLLGEKSISAEKDSAGCKELLRAIQERELDDEMFHLLTLGITGLLSAASGISQTTVDKMLPDLILMVNHKQEAIRSVGKNIYTALGGNRRIAHVLNATLATVIEKLQGFDGDFREAAARTLPQLLSHINESNSDSIDYIDLWNSVLRCCDDTRENVRIVASGTCMDLLRTTIRIVNEAREIPKWVNQLLEIIITQYIESTSTPSVIVGMTLLNKWGDSKRGLPLLFPFASRLIPTLIQKCTITEQVNISKGATRKRDYGEVEKETLEKMKSGDFLRVCIKIIDSDALPLSVMQNIAPQVGTLIKQGVGVNARGMAIYIASRIGLKWKQRASECVGKMLAPCLPLLGSTSDALRSEAASAIPSLIGASSQKTKSNFCSRLDKLYFELRESDTENTIGYVLDGSVPKFDADLAPFIGPICWLGKFDESQQRFFDSAWDKGEFQVRQIGEEIVSLCCKAARSGCWSFRLQGVKALKAAAETNQLEPRRVVSDILLSLDQRAFAGKEDLIECLTIITLQANAEDLKLSNIEILAKETARGSPGYKAKIFKSLSELCENIQKESRQFLNECFRSLFNDPVVCPESKTLFAQISTWGVLSESDCQQISSKLPQK